MVIVGVTLWLIFGIYFLPLIVVLPYFYSKFKKRYNRGFVGHLLYFSGLADFKGYPNFFSKDFIE